MQTPVSEMSREQLEKLARHALRQQERTARWIKKKVAEDPEYAIRRRGQYKKANDKRRGKNPTEMQDK